MTLFPAPTASGQATPDGLAYDVLTPIRTLAAGVLSPTSSGSDNAAGLLLDAANGASSFFSNGAALRSYLLRVYGRRPAAYPLGAGGEGVDDAAIYAMYRSYAADGAGVQQRGINAQARHSGASGGSLGNLIGTNAGTSVTLAGDCIALTLVNEDYAAGTGGVSGALDLVHLHEGPNATGGEFGLRIRNQKKNGSAVGAYIALDDSTSTTALAYGIDMSAAVMGTAEIRLTNGMVIQSRATAVSDGDATTLPASSIVLTSHDTGKGQIFISDGSNLQIMTRTA